MRILAVSGSLREGSLNTRLLRALLAKAPSMTETRMWVLQPLPDFNEDIEAPPPAEVDHLRTSIRAVDALLITTPEYNGAPPGHLKTWIDWASRPFGSSALSGKPAIVCGASPAPSGAQSAVEITRSVLARAGADVFSESMIVPHAPAALDSNDRFVEHDMRAKAEALLASASAYVLASEVIA